MEGFFFFQKKKVHRINTYPLVHLGWLHLLLNLVAWVPLSERFEREVGSAKMGGLLLGREFFFFFFFPVPSLSKNGVMLLRFGGVCR